MESIIQLATQMQWPFAVAVVGIGVGIAVAVIVRSTVTSNERIKQIQADEHLEAKRIDVNLKNTATPMVRDARNDG